MGRGGCHSVRNLDRMRCENAGGGSTRRAGQPVTISRRTSAFTDLGPSPDLADSGRAQGWLRSSVKGTRLKVKRCRAGAS